MSTAGAGAGSLLSEESAFLNPASIAFFNNSVFYYQNNSNTAMENENNEESSIGRSQVFAVSDTNGPIKGTLSYQDQSEYNFERRRMTLSLAKPVSKDTSIGFLYKNTRDLEVIPTGELKDTYHQVSIGTSHIVSPHLILGAVVNDPFSTREEDSTITVGFQYDYKSMIFFIGDIGSNYNLGVSDNSFFKGAIQLRFFEEIYLRFGTFSNDQHNTQGTGWGIAWIGPKMSLHLGALETEVKDSSEDSILQTDQSIQELGFSLSFRV